MQIDKIYVDMDGVIADFEKRYTELYGKLSEDERKNKFRTNFNEFILTQQFATLDLMPDAHMLISYLVELNIPKEILSSTAYPEVYESIARQKTTWLNTHKIDWPRNLVPGKRHKYKWATPTSIIIDDTPSVIEDWREAGGIGILHKDAVSTLAELKICLNKPYHA